MTRPRSNEPGERLTRTLLDLANNRQRPRCGDPETHHLWTSEEKQDRETAAAWCAGCPILQECDAAATANNEKFGVWAGKDRDPKTPTNREDQP